MPVPAGGLLNGMRTKGFLCFLVHPLKPCESKLRGQEWEPLEAVVSHKCLKLSTNEKVKKKSATHHHSNATIRDKSSVRCFTFMMQTN